MPSLAHDHERGRLVGRVVRVRRVRHHDDGRLRKLAAAIRGQAVRSDRGRHPGAGRAAPERVVARADAEPVRVLEDVRERGGQILGGDRAAVSSSVPQHEAVVSPAADLCGVREAFVDAADVGEPSARTDHGERRPGPSAKVEKAGPLSCGLLPPLGLGVEPIEDGLAVADIVDHVIERARHRLRIDMAVVREQRADVGQRHVLVVSPVVPRQQQVAEFCKCRVFREVSQAAARGEMTARPSAHVDLPCPSTNGRQHGQ